MTEPTDKRLIEYFIPIKQISAEASREKSIRHGHISTLHLWWARRPLVASRAAVFAALVPWDAKPQIVDIDTNQPMTLNKLMIRLCKWEVEDEILNEARRLIREQYPDNPPKVLDMFAGGGSIPLEALRLGCEAYALDLNPVAHIIELATLVYPQKYGAQLAEDVRKWGQWVLERVRAEVGDLYPLIPDPEYDPTKPPDDIARRQTAMFKSPSPLEGEGDLGGEGDNDDDLNDDESLPRPEGEGDLGGEGFLQPVAYLWTRTVTCPNPACRATVPLVRQTWLKKKKGDNVALEMTPHPTENRMMFTVRRAADANGFGFDPAGFSQRGNSVCYRCGTTVTSDYVKTEGKAGRMHAQMMATVCVRPGARGKVYLSPDEHDLPVPDDDAIRGRIEALTAETGITPPEEPLPQQLTGGMCTIYGLDQFYKLFTTRQMLTLLTFVKGVRAAHDALTAAGADPEYVKAVVTYLGLAHSRLTSIMSTQSRWRGSEGERVVGAFARQAIPMVWDFAELMPFNSVFTSWNYYVSVACDAIENLRRITACAVVARGSATELPSLIPRVDAVVTDPPYYDNISYADLSDYFYVWLKKILGNLYPEHLSTEITPKKKEAIAASYRHSDDRDAREFYEGMMLESFTQANTRLRQSGRLVTVYAHKTTAGWSTLVDSLRHAGFELNEAWPIDTELAGRAVAQDTAALASSFFLVARKREDAGIGIFTDDVQPDMRRIVKERVGFFLERKITGADLNIAAVGAGLAPFTRYARVELPNGEELSAAAYLDAVQAEVVRVLLGEASRTDPVTQYYIMGRSYYAEAQVEFDEANTLARATGVELDTGQGALTRGSAALVEKKGSKVRLRNYAERGDSESLGLPGADGRSAPLIDVLHRLLWLTEHESRKIQDFLNQASPEKYLLRLTAQALSGRALAGEPMPGMVRDERTGEQRAIDTLLAAWRRVVDEGAML
ncbi:MAG: hypothetical protein AELANPGJ_02848 [Anaerolineae bacterium]|nr:hypothetical protein [Anaerolineae bacterium]